MIHLCALSSAIFFINLSTSVVLLCSRAYVFIHQVETDNSACFSVLPSATAVHKWHCMQKYTIICKYDDFLDSEFWIQVNYKKKALYVCLYKLVQFFSCAICYNNTNWYIKSYVSVCMMWPKKLWTKMYKTINHSKAYKFLHPVKWRQKIVRVFLLCHLLYQLIYRNHMYVWHCIYS